MSVGVGSGLGGVGGFDKKLTEEGGDIRTPCNAYIGVAGLFHGGPGALACNDDAAAVHVKVGVHVRLGTVAAEYAYIAVAGDKPCVFADGDALSSVPLEFDACLALLSKAHAGGVDDAVQVHIGVGLQCNIALGLGVCAAAHARFAAFGDVHADLVGAAGNARNVVAGDFGVSLHLAPGLSIQAAACKEFAVKVSLCLVVVHIHKEFVSSDGSKTHIDALAGQGFKADVAVCKDACIADDIQLCAGADTGLGACGINGALGFEALAAHGSHAGCGKLRLGVLVGSGGLGLQV